MIIKVLGTGCPNCVRLELNVKEAIEDLKIDATVEKITEIKEIMKYNIMKTPALVLDEKVVSFGKVNTVEEIKGFLG
jgi:small redox-active disulfide protein 2